MRPVFSEQRMTKGRQRVMLDPRLTKNGISGSLTCLLGGHRELTDNQTFQALQGFPSRSVPRSQLPPQASRNPLAVRSGHLFECIGNQRGDMKKVPPEITLLKSAVRSSRFRNLE